MTNSFDFREGKQIFIAKKTRQNELSKISVLCSEIIEDVIGKEYDVVFNHIQFTDIVEEESFYDLYINKAIKFFDCNDISEIKQCKSFCALIIKLDKTEHVIDKHNEISQNKGRIKIIEKRFLALE